jgi:hypothetical protein
MAEILIPLFIGIACALAYRQWQLQKLDQTVTVEQPDKEPQSIVTTALGFIEVEPDV